MQKLEKFDKMNLKHLRVQIQAALDAVGKENGISLQMKNIRFADFNFKVQLDAKIEGKEPTVIDYSDIYPYLGLPKIGFTFQNLGETFKVVEHKPGSPKFPVVAVKVLTGQRYKFPASVAKKQLSVQP